MWEVTHHPRVAPRELDMDEVEARDPLCYSYLAIWSAVHHPTSRDYPWFGMFCFYF